MISAGYFEAVRRLLEVLEKEQGENIAKAGEMIAGAVANGKVVHIHDTGHILNQEAFGRAGGPLFVFPFSFGLNVNSPVNHPRGQTRVKGSMEDRLRFIGYALDTSNIVAGDVLIISSVSGTSAEIVELASAAMKRGVKVIALTTTTYAKAPGVKSEYPSGKFLYQMCDICIDHPGEVGDGVLELPGLSVKICPTSGITAVCAFWAIMAEAMDGLTRRGIVPSVLRKVHIEGSDDYNSKARERYSKLGY